MSPGSQQSLSPSQLEENELLRAYHERGDASARDRLVEANLPLARAIARRYAGRGEPLEDLVQVASIGLIKAIDRFDLERGVFFRTYAVPTIVGEIKRHFRDRAWAVHVPRRLKELNQMLSSLIQDLSAQLERSPTVAELAQAAGVEEEEVVEALESSPRLHGRVADGAGRGGLRARPPADARRRRGGIRADRGQAPRWRPDSRRSSRASGGSSSFASRTGSRRPRSPTSSASRRCTSPA